MMEKRMRGSVILGIGLLAALLLLAACGGGGGGGSGNGGGTGSTDCVLDTSAKLDSCKLG